MSALREPGSVLVTRDDLVATVVRLRTALAEVARTPAAMEALECSTRVVARDAARAELEFWALAWEAAPRTQAAAEALRCAALSAEFAADEAAAAREEGWG